MEQQLTSIIYAQFGAGGVIFLILAAALWKLYSDQRKSLVESAHQLNRDLVSRRGAAYASLWSKMEPLAIYSSLKFDPEKSKELFVALSAWYFSETGGLFLTNRTRDFYLSLQSFLQSIANMSDWVCLQRPEDTDKLFMTILEEMAEGRTDVKQVLESLKEGQVEKIDAENWKSSCKLVLEYLSELVQKSDAQSGNLIFASVQQISSILRTSLTHEVHSRLSVDWPEI